MNLNKVYFLFFVYLLSINSLVLSSNDLVASIVKDTTPLAIQVIEGSSNVLSNDANVKISHESLKNFIQKINSVQPMKGVLSFGQKVYTKSTENPTITAGAVCCLLMAAGLLYFLEKDKQACHESIVALSEKTTIIGFLCTQYLLIEQKINGILDNLKGAKTDEEKVFLNSLVVERDKIETAILAIYKKENSFFTRLKSIIYKSK